MTTPLNSAAVGALVRETRVADGLTQTQLGERIGASRFWVAAFEKGKPSAELGLALKAIQALGLVISVASDSESSVDTTRGRATAPQPRRQHPLTADVTLASIVANATLTHAAQSTVSGWPRIPAAPRLPRPTTRRRKG